jgi:hypothetical protein
LRPGAAVLAAALLACPALLAGCGSGEEPDPAAERLSEIADPRAAEVVRQALAAYGGPEALARHRNVEYAYRLVYFGGQREPQAVTRQVHRLGLGPEARAYVEDLSGPSPQIVRLDGDRLEVTRGGRPLTDPAEAGFPRAFAVLARWSFRQPWSLLEPGSRLTYRGVSEPPAAGTAPAGPCDVVRLTVAARDGAHPGGGEGAWTDIYFSRLSRLIDRIHTFRPGDGVYRVAVLSDHRLFDGVRVALHRETFASDALGALGPLEVVAEYGDVRFDAPFGDEVFAVESPLAASAAPE